MQMLFLIIAEMAAAYARVAVSPVQEAMRTGLSLTDNQMALLQGPALAAPIVVAAIPLGLAIDRYLRVRIVLIAALLSVVGSVLTALAPAFPVLFLARCIVGLAGTAINMTALSLLADLYLPAQRGRANAAVVVAQYAGMSAAFALGGLWIGLGWRWTMLCLSAPLALSVFTSLAMREPPRTGSVIVRPSVRASFAELWRYRALVGPLIAGVVLSEMALFAMLTWAAPALVRGFSAPAGRAGAIMATGLMVTGVLGPIAGGALADLCQRAGKARRTQLVLATIALLSVPVSLFPFAPSLGSAAVLLVALMVLISASLAMGATLLIVVIPNELRGLCLAIFAAAVVVLGVAFAPVSVSLLSGVIGGPDKLGTALSVVCMAAGLLSAAVFVSARGEASQAGVRCTP
jgi:MFS family permease